MSGGGSGERGAGAYTEVCMCACGRVLCAWCECVRSAFYCVCMVVLLSVFVCMHARVSVSAYDNGLCACGTRHDTTR
jgi:hypothetical protein